MKTWESTCIFKLNKKSRQINVESIAMKIYMQEGNKFCNNTGKK